MHTHRQIAKRKTALWQGAAVAVLLAAGAAIALPGVREFLAPPAPVEKKAQAAPAEPATAAAITAPVGEAKLALDRVSGWSPKPAEAPSAAAEQPNTEIPPAPAPVSDWVYAGSFISPSSRTALIKIDNDQQLLPLDAVLNDTKLVTIEPEFIEIERAGARKRIDIAQRTAFFPSDPPKKPVNFRTSPPPPGGAGAPMAAMARPGMPNPIPVSQPAQTFEQARMAALAAREAAARAAAVQNGAQAGTVEMNGQKYDQSTREEAIKYLLEPDQPPEVRLKYLETIGIKPGMPVEAATEIAQKMGLDVKSEAAVGALQAIRRNAGVKDGDPKEGK
jgi:hypothetical protein